MMNLSTFPEENLNPLYRISKDGVLLYANPASRRLISEIQTRIGDKISEELSGIIKKVYESGEKQQNTMEFSGRTYLFELIPVIDCEYVNLYAIDITEHKRSEKELRCLANVVRDSNDAITIQDFEGRITAWNRGAELMYGYSEEEALSSNIDRLTTPNKVAEQKDFISRLVAGDAITSFETQRLTKDGRVLDVWLTVTKLIDDAGKPIGLASTERDITKRKRAEETALQSALELQKKNTEMERFLYTVSHDLKSPVVTVRTFLGYLEQDMANDKAERIEKDMLCMRTAADNMAQMLDSILELSRIGRIAILSVHITFRTLVEETLVVMAGRIAERGVQTKVSEHDVSLYGDRLQLAEIWQNLVENAIKFMGDQPEPCIEIGVEPLDADMLFFVRDNGIGIDPHFHAKIFNLFERIETKTEGAGVGLAVVRRIVEVYGGRIWVESAGQRQGTCFYFSLPKAINRTGGEKT